MPLPSNDIVYDVAVIGAGIIGASAAQHLVAAGYKTILFERDDYGGGTSSRTSRLQHCGLSYFSPAANSIAAFLLKPEFGLKCLELACRAMRGRAEFVRSCPERVRAVPFYVPLTDENAVSTGKARLAFRILSAFSGGVPLDTRFYTAAEARQLPVFRGLAGLERIRGAISFTEYQFRWPERIVNDTIVKARRAGLTACNYTGVTNLRREADFWRIGVHTRTGETGEVRARAIANTAGVWVDEITRMAGVGGADLNVGAKGTNIVVKLPDHLRGIGFDTVTSTGMAFYFIPWNDLHYIGPWDSPADGERKNFRATEGDIDAILREINMLFPNMKLAREDVLYSWAGVRPRTADGNDPLGSMEVREHDLSPVLPNFVVFTGGLLMTHRDAGRRITRAIARHISPAGQPTPIDYGVPRQPDEARWSHEAVCWAIEEEQATTLAGILRRRLSVGWERALGLDLAEETSHIAAPLLGWDEKNRLAELDHYRQETAYFYGVQADAERSVADILRTV
ncbi:FAD-dependent oxidoreductase [Labrys sp. WJW]|uniref:FAD-dependent oxidoreductase n=1 Tax=Labrys sp. WJW TaxID=1737983 RepID=UPI00082D2FAB|nr:FAD-dependent oxidoreductase [Labrys sp. WJW]OCC05367.1 FAD-dependent oxidoreductase [Labrys sp. WJW]